ncbi:hypothetical protein [Bradyrhizobium sp. CB2312]|nr:hypothetical protein [Bradyrhizobium sp. CB2312]WFU71261.1 hypothetical protein QA642_39590 [Bradyrhizobium sp. CB2312]
MRPSPFRRTTVATSWGEPKPKDKLTAPGAPDLNGHRNGIDWRPLHRLLI